MLAVDVSGYRQHADSCWHSCKFKKAHIYLTPESNAMLSSRPQLSQMEKKNADAAKKEEKAQQTVGKVGTPLRLRRFQFVEEYSYQKKRAAQISAVHFLEKQQLLLQTGLKLWAGHQTL